MGQCFILESHEQPFFRRFPLLIPGPLCGGTQVLVGLPYQPRDQQA